MTASPPSCVGAWPWGFTSGPISLCFPGRLSKGSRHHRKPSYHRQPVFEGHLVSTCLCLNTHIYNHASLWGTQITLRAFSKAAKEMSVYPQGWEGGELGLGLQKWNRLWRPFQRAFPGAFCLESHAARSCSWTRIPSSTLTQGPRTEAPGPGWPADPGPSSVSPLKGHMAMTRLPQGRFLTHPLLPSRTLVCDWRGGTALFPQVHLRAEVLLASELMPGKSCRTDGQVLGMAGGEPQGEAA